MANNFDAYNKPNSEFGGYTYQNPAGDTLYDNKDVTHDPKDTTGTKFFIQDPTPPDGYTTTNFYHTHPDDNPLTDGTDPNTSLHFSPADIALATSLKITIYVGVDVTILGGASSARVWYSYDPRTKTESKQNTLPRSVKC